MDNKKSIKIIVITIIGYVILYVLLKLFIVYNQDLYMQNEITEKTYGIGNVMQIYSYSKEDRKQINYFKSQSPAYSMKVKNYFEGFEEGDHDDNYEYYMLYDEDDNIKAVFMMGMFDSKISTINSYSEDSYYYEFNHFPLYISKMLKDYYLKKNNIMNDIDLIKYIRARKKEDCNFWTPIIKIKENYFFNFVESNLPTLDTITYLEGDIEGYMYESDSFKQACILNGDNLYCLTFFKLDYFTNEMIEDILKSLVIES